MDRLNPDAPSERYLPALEQLRCDIEIRLEQHPITSRWTLQHAEAAHLLLNAVLTGWRAGRVDTAALRALRAVCPALNDATATVLRGSLDIIDAWHDEFQPPTA